MYEKNYYCKTGQLPVTLDMLRTTKLTSEENADIISLSYAHCKLGLIF
jgi:hypothetical protein